jgi:hypothetical protein
MVSKGVFYGVVVTFLALLLISSTFAIVYFNDYQQEASQNSAYANDLGRALVSYRSLAESYNSSLQDYNATLSLLASAVANLNSSTPAYRNASLALSSLWNSYQQLARSSGRRALVYEVHMLLDFGNGTTRWFNDTQVQPGWNGFVVTLVLLKGNVQAVWYTGAGFGAGEHFVTELDGVSQTSSEYWGIWQFSGGEWTYLQTGADLMQVLNGTTFAWTLCGFGANYKPTCTP